MGLETLAIISAVSSVAGGIAQGEQQRKAENAAKERNAISGASEQIKDQLNRRRAAREMRLNRARLLQSSENSGTTSSSGQMGADSAMGSNYGSAVANQAFGQKTVAGINRTNNKIAGAESRSQQINAWGNAFGSVIKAGQSMDIFGE